MRPRGSALHASALGVACVLLAAPARAMPEPTPDARNSAATGPDAAREEFRSASRLAETGDWAGALGRYRRSFALFPHATTLYNIGYCHEMLGDLAAAIRDTRAALAFETSAPERGLAEPLRARASRALGELEAKVGTLELVLAGSGLALRVDGRPLELLVVEGRQLGFSADTTSPSWTPVDGTLRIPLNPGAHLVEWRSSAGGGSRRAELHAGETRRWTLPDAPASVPVAPVPRPQHAPRPATEATAPAAAATTAARTAGFVVLTAGGAAALVGLGSGWVASSTQSTLDERCAADGACPASESMRVSRFHTAATVSTVAFVGAFALSGVGLTLVLLNPDAAPAPRVALRVSSAVTVHGSF